MRRKTIGWLMAVSAAAMVTFLVGLVWTFAHILNTESGERLEAQPVLPVIQNEASAEEDGSIRILALGDSLVRGAGDSEGKGFVGYVAETLDEQLEQSVVLNNLGVDGLTSSELSAMLEEEALRREAAAADYVFVSIGANDLFQRGETLMNMDAGSIAPLQVQYNETLRSILAELRELNAHAPIYMIGLYNPFIEFSETEITSKIVRDWNYETAETASQYANVVIVPTFDLFQIDVQQYLHTDMFHPNTEGYRRIADRAAVLISSLEVASNE